MRNRQVLLASRPKGRAEESNFRLVEVDVPELREGELLTRVLWLSLDPYMRGRMDEARSYAPPQPLGEVMLGGTVAEVQESRNPSFRPGDLVVGSAGWQEYQVTDGTGLRKVDKGPLSPSVYLGAVGMPGVTAWYGLARIGRPRPGETVFVTAAAGAVGSVAGQLAKILGCRVVGVAGGESKRDFVKRELGFDECIDYKAEPARVLAALEAATPNGIDVLFENVGGPLLDRTLARMNPFGRIALCGLIAGYSGGELTISQVRKLLVNRLLLQGFIVSDHLDVWPQALRELAGHVAAGHVKIRETVAHGLESAPRAFIGMLRGENLGKQLVKIA